MKGTTTYKQESRRDVFTENLNGLKVLLDNTLPFEQKKSQELVKWGNEFHRESEEIVSSINVFDVDDVISLSEEIQCTLKYINDTINAASVEQLPTVRLAKDASNKLQAALQEIGNNIDGHTAEIIDNSSVIRPSDEEFDFSTSTEHTDDKAPKEEYIGLENDGTEENVSEEEHPIDRYEKYVGKELIEAAKKALDLYSKEHVSQYIMRSKYEKAGDVFYINISEDGERIKVKFTSNPTSIYSYSVTVYSDEVEKGVKRIAFITIADIYGIEVSDEDYTKPAEEEPEDPISRKEKEGKALIEIEANIVNTLNAYVDFWKTSGDYRGKKDEARLTKKIEIAGSEWDFKFIFNNEADDGNQITIISENNSSVIMGSREDIGDAIEQLAEKILKDIYGDEAINDMYRLKRTLKQNDSETEIGERWDF